MKTAVTCTSSTSLWDGIPFYKSTASKMYSTDQRTDQCTDQCTDQQQNTTGRSQSMGLASFLFFLFNSYQKCLMLHRHAPQLFPPPHFFFFKSKVAVP